MSGIKRYAWNGDSSRSGELVLYSDHEAEVARLRVMAQEQGVKDGNEITRLRAEVEKNRVDAERYRWLRDCSAWSDAKNPCPYSKSDDGQLRCITTGLDEAIDAAMGEGK